MAYLELSNPTTDSCEFEVKLSNAFNTKYYRELRITGRDYGSSTSRVSSYVERRTARSSYSSRYVEGVVNDGMSAGRTYKLYAYAQAQNGTWYRAGSDTITMKSSEKIFDLGIRQVEPAKGHIEPFEIGEPVTFDVEIKNYEEKTSPRFRIVVTDVTYSKYTPRLKRTGYYTVRGDETDTIPVTVDTTWGVGERDLKFEIEADADGYKNDDKKDDARTYTYKWENNIPDDVGTRIMQKAEKILKDNPDLLEELRQNRTHSPKLKNALNEIRKEVIKETKGSADSAVIGIVAEAEARYIVGGYAGAGVYLDGNGEILVGPHFSGGVVYGTPNVGAAVKVVIFPWAEGIDTVKGLGLTIGAGLQAYSASITNLDPKTVCFSADLLSIGPKVFQIKNASLSVQCGGVVSRNEAQVLSTAKQKELINRLNKLDLSSL